MNYESNFNESVKYNDITPFEFPGIEEESNYTRKNMPYFLIKRAKNTTCEEYDKLSTGKFFVAAYMI